ncbi:DUF1427 family protein [Cupriavidus sp. YAF13]|uniref:DUF1427 family protein n=1 Tax=Cupriavidus sp. YAF13 TaxID=3233075 RepID=UPI003F8F607D
MSGLLAFSLGLLCRATGIPSPAPPWIMSALLVVSMTCGYLIVDHLQARREASGK